MTPPIIGKYNNYMKYIITESQIKNFIEKNFKKNFSVEMLQTFEEFPYIFKKNLGSNNINHALHYFGPMFLIKDKRITYLVQERSIRWYILTEDNYDITQNELMLNLGIYPLGLSMNDFINAYFQEEI